MQKVVDLSHRGPEFDAFSREAVIACIGAGAAKFSGIISPESIQRLVEDGVARHPALMIDRVPELRSFYNLFGIDYELEPQSRGCRIAELDLPAATSQPQKKLVSHIDGVAPIGISLLIPFEGGEAIFGADENEFGEGTPPPSFLTTYGIGDAIMLRQSVTTFPDDRYYGQIHHLGISSSDRTLLATDVLRQQIDLESIQETSGLGV